MSLLCGLAKPFSGLGVILTYSKSIVIHKPQIKLSAGVSILRRHVKPLRGICEILSLALSEIVHQPKGILSVWGAFRGFSLNISGVFVFI